MMKKPNNTDKMVLINLAASATADTVLVKLSSNEQDSESFRQKVIIVATTASRMRADIETNTYVAWVEGELGKAIEFNGELLYAIKKHQIVATAVEEEEVPVVDNEPVAEV